MGNCLMSAKVVAQNKTYEEQCDAETIQHRRKHSPAGADGGNRKRVTFRLPEEDNVDGKTEGEVVRIKLVVTQDELREILNYGKDHKYSSAEHLVRTLKLRGRQVSEVEMRDEGVNGSWRPALESIPEHH